MKRPLCGNSSHSVETSANRAFAWRFWSDVSNWAFDSSIEWVRLEGPFASGTKGATKSPGLDPVYWVLKDVRAEEEATVEMTPGEASLRFHWRFEDTAGAGTRLIQRVTLTGPGSESLAEQAALEFERGIPEGMQKLAALMTAAGKKDSQKLLRLASGPLHSLALRPTAKRGRLIETV